MITKKSYKFLGMHFKIAYLSGSLPFIWDPITETLSVTTSKLMLGMWYLNILVSLAIEGRLVYTIYRAIVYDDRQINLFVVDVLFSVPYTGILIWQVTAIFMKEEMANLFNQILKFDKLYTNKYCKNFEEQSEFLYADKKEKLFKEKNASKIIEEKEETDGCDGNIFASTFMMFVYAILAISLYLKQPMDVRYLCGDIVRLLNYSDPDMIQMMIYNWAYMEYMQLIRFCCVFNNIFYIIMLYAHSTNFWLEQLSRPTDVADLSTRKIIRPVQPDDALKIYKAEQVLNKHFNSCCRPIIFPTFKLLNMTLHIIATYVTIMFHDRIPIGGYLIFPIGFFMWCVIEKDVYPLLGKIYQLSGIYLDSWRSVLGPEASRDFAASFRIGVQVSNFYMIQKHTVLSVWAFVSGQVVNCIVMTPS